MTQRRVENSLDTLADFRLYRLSLKSNPLKAEYPSLSLRKMASMFTVKYGRPLSKTAIYKILKKQKNAERALAVTNLTNA